MAAACPRWYNAALTHTKWMGNPSLPTLSSNCEKRRACFCQMSPGIHVWGVLPVVPIRTVFKEVRGSFAILFWLPCATWHRVMTHTYHTQSFRSTDAFLRHSTPGPISEVSWGFLLHPSGLSFGFQARCTGSTRTKKRRRFQKGSVVDWMMPESEEWIRRKRRRRRSIDEQASGCMVDLLNLSWAVLCGRQCDFSFFCAGGPGEWAVVRLLRRRWTPAQDSCWSRQRRLLDVDLVSVFTIS